MLGIYFDFLRGADRDGILLIRIPFGTTLLYLRFLAFLAFLAFVAFLAFLAFLLLRFFLRVTMLTAASIPAAAASVIRE